MYTFITDGAFYQRILKKFTPRKYPPAATADEMIAITPEELEAADRRWREYKSRNAATAAETVDVEDDHGGLADSHNTSRPRPLDD